LVRAEEGLFVGADKGLGGGNPHLDWNKKKKQKETQKKKEKKKKNHKKKKKHKKPKYPPSTTSIRGWGKLLRLGGRGERTSGQNVCGANANLVEKARDALLPLSRGVGDHLKRPGGAQIPFHQAKPNIPPKKKRKKWPDSQVRI